MIDPLYVLEKAGLSAGVGLLGMLVMIAMAVWGVVGDYAVLRSLARGPRTFLHLLGLHDAAWRA